MEKNLPLDVELTRKRVHVLRALNNLQRQEIIALIHSSQPIKATDIYKTLKISQSIAYSQLAVLREDGFVRWERSGKEVYCSLNYDRFRKVNGPIKQMINDTLSIHGSPREGASGSALGNGRTSGRTL
jgi:DNA-binding transcriptional ArsR family regulator